jgi:hypothetical protein
MFVENHTKQLDGTNLIQNSGTHPEDDVFEFVALVLRADNGVLDLGWVHEKMLQDVPACFRTDQISLQRVKPGDSILKLCQESNDNFPETMRENK